MSAAVTAASGQPDAAAQQRSGTRQLLLGRAWFIVTGYVVSVLLARSLAPADYGDYGVLVSVVTWIGMLTSAGVPGATSKLLAQLREDTRSVEGAARLLLLGLGVVLFVVAWFAAPALAEVLRLPSGSTVFRIAILDLPFIAIYAIYQGILGGHRRFGLLAGAQAVYGATKLGGVLGLLALGLTLERVLIVNATATATVCAFLMLRYPMPWGRPKPDVVRHLVRVAVPVGIYLIAGQVLINLDLWSLKHLWTGNRDTIGHYVASLNIAKTLLIIPVVQSSVLLASVAWAMVERNRDAARHHIQEASRFAIILAVPACALLVADASAVLGVLFSPPYAAGGKFLELQLVGFALFGLLDAYAMALMASGGQWLAARVLLGVVPVVLLANTLLIPRFGGMGAALSLVTGTVLAALALGTFTYRRFGALIPGRTLGRVALAAGVVVGLAEVIHAPGVWLFAKLAGLGLLYLAMLAVTGEITKADLGLPAMKAPPSSDLPPEGDPPVSALTPRS